MNQLKLVTLSLMLFMGTIMTSAKEGEKLPIKSITKEITTLLSNSELEFEQDTDVMVTFIVNKNKEIVVLTTNSKNNSVNLFIKSKLNYKKLKSKLTVGKEYKLPIVFRS